MFLIYVQYLLTGLLKVYFILYFTSMFLSFLLFFWDLLGLSWLELSSFLLTLANVVLLHGLGAWAGREGKAGAHSSRARWPSPRSCPLCPPGQTTREGRGGCREGLWLEEGRQRLVDRLSHWSSALGSARSPQPLPRPPPEKCIITRWFCYCVDITEYTNIV